MKLSIYLGQEDVTSFEQLIQEKYRGENGTFVRSTPIMPLPFECEAYIQVNKTTRPKWAPFLEPHFDTDLFHNVTNSFVLLLKAEGRYFAVSFGHGHVALEWSHIEPRFGLRVALNSCEEVQTVDTRQIDMVTRQRRTHMNKGSRIYEFGLDLVVDWVRFVACKPTKGDLAKSVAGSDSLAVTVDCELRDLDSKCAAYLRRYRTDRYQRLYPFIDQLEPLAKSDSRIAALDAAVTELILSRRDSRIAMAAPDIPSVDSFWSYTLSCRYGRQEIDDLTIPVLYDFLDNHRSPDDQSDLPDPLNDVSIIPWNDSGVKDRRRKLRDYIVCEVHREDEVFVLTLGYWFRVKSEYVRDVRERASLLPDMTTELDMPRWELSLNAKNEMKPESEGVYNQRAAQSKGWLLLDKDNLNIPHSYDKNELCDLLTANWCFISVKKMTSSATLSHLFAQGSVSAKLLRTYPPFLEKVNEVADKNWPGNVLSPQSSQPRFVYAIATPKDGDLSEGMFFFSIVNLLHHVDIIRSTGFEVALCKIEQQPNRQKR